jgi:hypothetical protein
MGFANDGVACLPKQRHQSIYVLEVFSSCVRLVQVMVDDRGKDEHRYTRISSQDLRTGHPLEAIFANGSRRSSRSASGFLSARSTVRNSRVRACHSALEPSNLTTSACFSSLIRPSRRNTLAFSAESRRCSAALW